MEEILSHSEMYEHPLMKKMLKLDGVPVKDQTYTDDYPWTIKLEEIKNIEPLIQYDVHAKTDFPVYAWVVTRFKGRHKILWTCEEEAEREHNKISIYLSIKNKILKER